MYVGKRGREGGAFVVVVNCGKRSCVVAVFPAGSSDFVGEPWEVFASYPFQRGVAWDLSLKKK